MQPRFVGRLGLADVVTLGNAVIGFLAVAVASANPILAAQLILLAAILDGLDGVVARRYGGSAVGSYLDSLADVASFSVAPAALVVAVAVEEFTGTIVLTDARVLLTLAVAALYVGFAVTRLALYTAYDTEEHYTEGIQTTLAGTLLAATVLAAYTSAVVLVAAMLVLAVLMVSTVRYPDLYAQDALIMGVVQTLAVLAPAALSRAFPRAMMVLAAAYLVFAPRFYWRAA